MIEDKIAAAEDGYDILRIGSDELTCPCFGAYRDGQGIDGQCWRSHGFCTVRFTGISPEMQARAKALLDELDWYGEWVVLPWDPERWMGKSM